MSDDQIVICRECNYASRLREWSAQRVSTMVRGNCPNPACWGGISEYGAAFAAWDQRAGAYVQKRYAESQGTGVSWTGTALRDQFERENPRPVRAEFECPHRGYIYPASQTLDASQA